MGSEAFVASGDKEKAERVSRNERPTAATIEAADAARRRETSAFGKAIVLSENSISSAKPASRGRGVKGRSLRPSVFQMALTRNSSIGCSYPGTSITSPPQSLYPRRR